MDRNSLEQRVRDGILFDCYGAMLTEKQRSACEMIFSLDLSLAEAAETLGVSRQGVHDLLTRSRERMEEYEAAFGAAAGRRKTEKLLRLVEEYRDRLPIDFYDKVKEISEA